MSPDDIGNLVLKLHDFLVLQLGCQLNEDDDYVVLQDFMYNALDPFVTKDRNYN